MYVCSFVEYLYIVVLQFLSFSFFSFFFLGFFFLLFPSFILVFFLITIRRVTSLPGFILFIKCIMRIFTIRFFFLFNIVFHMHLIKKIFLFVPSFYFDGTTVFFLSMKGDCIRKCSLMLHLAVAILTLKMAITLFFLLILILLFLLRR